MADKTMIEWCDRTCAKMERGRTVTISAVLGRGRWQGVEDPYLRASLLEARAEALDAEAARKVEQERAGLEATVREEIEGMGYEEYVPRAGASVEEIKRAKSNAWRKLWLAGRTPKQLARLKKINDELLERWKAREARKEGEYEEFVDECERLRDELAAFEAGAKPVSFEGIRF